MAALCQTPLHYFQLGQILRVNQINQFVRCVHDGQIVNVFAPIVLCYGFKKIPAGLCFDIAAAEN
jgi:hypothetical protein